MPKYRRLTMEELEVLKEDFIQFLAINGITGEDWSKIKSESSEKAKGIFDAFSDVVFEKVMRSTLFLDHVTETHIKAFQCLEDKMIVVGLELKSGVEKDLNQTPLSELSPGDYSLINGSKAYSKKREVELFEMVQQGCHPSDGTQFKALSLALAQAL